eukprot:GHVO01021302.1.p1 GENE.GHVO01021302.1~~GHVO01021302.1.p1  ORF type:complete len:325 (+),score=25.24 GHVO01021302.1:151-1125(+)
MLASRLALAPRSFVASLTKPNQASSVRYATRSTRVVRKARQATLKERAMAPASDKAFNIGKGVVAGASVLGLGGICFYGLGLSNEVGAIDRAVIWPDVVRHRIRDTYAYFGGSLFFTAASAVALSRSPRMMSLVMNYGWKSLLGTVAAMWGSGMLCMSLPYESGVGAKQLAWILHSSVVGAVVAPMTMLGGPILLRAAVYTAGVVGGLSLLAMCAPSDKFLNMGGPLAMGLGVVFASSMGTWFLPPTTALGAGMYSVALYGGLVLFGMFLLYDTQKIIRRAETHPVASYQRFDPVNNSVGIYMDTVNIFIRIATVLAGGGNRRK